MTIKSIIFDVDGVLLCLPHYFSKELENRGYQNAGEILTEFYLGENNICSEWKADAKEKILPYLEKLWWKEWPEEYFSQQFEFERQYFDERFVPIITSIQKQWINCYLWTDQEQNRAKYLLDWLGFRDIFDGYFISCFIWSRKCSWEFWNRVKKICTDGEIVFFDDLRNNIDVAKKSWIQAFLFTDLDQFYSDMELLWIHTRA